MRPPRPRGTLPSCATRDGGPPDGVSWVLPPSPPTRSRVYLLSTVRESCVVGCMCGGPEADTQRGVCVCGGGDERCLGCIRGHPGSWVLGVRPSSQSRHVADRP